MKVLYFIIAFLSYNLSNAKQLRSNNITESNFIESPYCENIYSCPPHSSCIWYNSTTNICSCNDDYASFNGFCNYKRKSALTSLLLTIFLQELAPVGKMYTLNGVSSTDDKTENIAIAELFTCGLLGGIILCIGISILSIPCLICSGCDEKSVTTCAALICSSVCVIITILTITWIIIDVIGFSENTIKDENGVSLIPI